MADVRERIDAVLADRKTLLDDDVNTSWRHMPDQGCDRWTGILAGSDGSPLDVRLVLDNYVSFGSDKFVLQLVHYGANFFPVMRLCFGADARHRNRPTPGKSLPSGIDAGWLHGSHMHHWSDNRQLATARLLPDDLRFARLIDESVKSFPAGFWLFCSEANIVCGQHQIPFSMPTGRLF